jgi:hypothetical protein
MSATADRLFDDYWFVLARPGRPRVAGGADREHLAPPAMRQSLLSAVMRKPQVMVKITSFAGSKEGLAAHLDYIARNGKNEVFDPQGSSSARSPDRWASPHATPCSITAVSWPLDRSAMGRRGRRRVARVPGSV